MAILLISLNGGLNTHALVDINAAPRLQLLYALLDTSGLLVLQTQIHAIHLSKMHV